MGKPGVSSVSTKAGESYTADSSKAEKVLGVKFRPLRGSIAELGRQLLDIERVEKSAAAK
jgi:hypothetical protein